MLVYGDGEQVRAFSDIQYYMEPFEKLIDCCDGEIFNLGSDQTHTLNELATLVKKAAKRNDVSATIGMLNLDTKLSTLSVIIQRREV